jgi:WD40 repeat protein
MVFARSTQFRTYPTGTRTRLALQMMKSPHFAAVSILALGASSTLFGADAGPKKTYTDDVFPILDAKCLNCHNTDEAKGGLDLASYATTLAGGSGGAVVVSEDPKGSRLFTLSSHIEEPIMPPKGTKMTDAELNVISDWIAGGLLETKNSKAKKSDKPKLDLTSVSASGKPEGPPPMPEHLILEPSVVTPRPNAVPALAHSPWAPILAVAGQKQILLYHSTDFDLLGVLPYPEGFPQTLNFSPNGAYLFCGGGRGGKSGNVVAWDIKTGERVIEVGKEFDIVLGADVSPDLKHAIMGGPGRVIKLWDTVKVEQVNAVKKHTDWLLSAAYSPDGVIYATGDRNGNLYVWEAATGYEFYTLKGHTLGVTDLDWRMDGNVLASSSEDGQVILWEMNNGSQVKKWAAHGGGVQAVEFAPNGNLVTAGRDKTVKIWKGDGTALKTINASEDVVLSVAYSEDSKRVFSGDIFGNIKAWDAESGAELARIDPNPPPIDQQLAYSQKRIGELTGQLPKLEEGVKAVSAELTAARAALAEVDKVIATSTQTRDAQKALVAKFDGAIKALAPQVEKLQQEANAKNAAVKTLSDGLNQATAALKPQQDEATRLVAEAAKRETEYQAAKAALDAAKAEAAKPALTAEQKTLHDSLAAAHAAAAKAREAANALVAAKTGEQGTSAAQLSEAQKVAAAAATNATQGKASADAAQKTLADATAAKAQADAALAAASQNGQIPAPALVQARDAAAARVAETTKAQQSAAAALAAAEGTRNQAVTVVKQVEAKAAAANAALAAAKQDQTAKADAVTKADTAFKPLRDAAAAGTARFQKSQADAAAKTTALAQVEKARNDAKTVADQANAKVAATNAAIAKAKTDLAAAQPAATAAGTALAAKQKELNDSRTQLAAAQAEAKKAEDALAAATKQKEGATAKVTAIVAKEAESKKSIEQAKSELASTQFLQRKWQAAAINLTAHKESANLDDMTVKLGDMVEEETVAKQGAEAATKSRAEAEATLASAKKTVAEGTAALQEKSVSVLERALALVSSRAVAELREEAIQGTTAGAADSALTSLSGNAESTVASDLPADPGAMPEAKEEKRKVAAETLSYKTPEEIGNEVASLKNRLTELEQFLSSTYVEATKTKTTVVAADQVARETPKVIAERSKAEQEAARELAEAEAERKRQEEALAAQKKRIEELRAKYLATVPKREG